MQLYFSRTWPDLFVDLPLLTLILPFLNLLFYFLNLTKEKWVNCRSWSGAFNMILCSLKMWVELFCSRSLERCWTFCLLVTTLLTVGFTVCHFSLSLPFTFHSWGFFKCYVLLLLSPFYSSFNLNRLHSLPHWKDSGPSLLISISLLILPLGRVIDH